MPEPSHCRTFKPLLELLETRDLPSSAPTWSGFARDPQHTAQSSIGSQSLDAIRWSTLVDANRQYSGNELLIHYGSPMVTAANTVLVPFKTVDSAGNTLWEVEAFRGADGSLLWTQQTDYIVPDNGWTPSFQPTLTPASRLYYQGIGGQVYYSDNIDSSGATRSGAIVFYGQANYNADPTDYNNNVKICTPITSDSAGNIYFGYQVTGYTPLGLTGGIARIDTSGNATYVSASSAAGDTGIVCMQFNSAPALSNDGTTLYVAVNSGSSGYGYLLALDSTTLATQSKTLLYDPKTGNLASLNDSGTSSPMVGPDGDVYFGVLENPFASNNDRGWLLHFSSDLQTAKTPGAFGWDDTPSVVLTSMIPSYSGPSTYLIMTKYNNYAGLGTGDGQNKIAVLDPNVSMTDPISGITVMNEVRTILGPTPDPDHPGGVREWCINSAVVDPATDSVLANSEDGKLYRWCLDENVLMQPTTLTPGIGEAYTPTIIGADGTVYAINNGTLFAVGQTGQISGQIYNDVNGNGIQDVGDGGLSGWTVFLDANNNGILDPGEVSTTTDANGNFSFGELAAGTYHVREIVPAGWVQTSANQDVTLAATQQVSGINYGNFQKVSISGTVFNDLNGNGTRDSGEPGLTNWTANVLDSHGNVVASGVTDSHGNYTITGVGPGSFTLAEVLQSGWIITQPTNPSSYSFTTSSGTNVAGGIFGNFKLISVSGNVYNDQNGDGLRNGGEPGLASWTVNLLNTTTGVLVSGNTDSSGNYSFTGAGPGAYTIAQVVQANWVQTQPLWPTFYSFSATSGHNISAAVFGDHASPALSPTAVIDNGTPGYSETGTWSNGSPGGFNGNNRIARTDHSRATATATWDFTGLSSGQYDVYVTFARGNTNQSKHAPFTVYDGGHSLGTTNFNESILVTQSSQPQSQGSYGGVGWLEVGSFIISSGELKVILNNRASENWVNADGVLIIGHGGSPIKGPSPARGTGSGGNESAVNGGAVLATGVADLTAISSALMQPSTPHAAAPSSNGSTGTSGTGNGSGSHGATFTNVPGKVWEILGAASGASTNGSAAAVDAAFASWDNSASSAAPGHNNYLAATGF